MKQSRKIFTLVLASFMALACFIARPTAVYAQDEIPEEIRIEDIQLKENGQEVKVGSKLHVTVKVNKHPLWRGKDAVITKPEDITFKLPIQSGRNRIFDTVTLTYQTTKDDSLFYAGESRAFDVNDSSVGNYFLDRDVYYDLKAARTNGSNIDCRSSETLKDKPQQSVSLSGGSTDIEAPVINDFWIDSDSRILKKGDRPIAHAYVSDNRDSSDRLIVKMNVTYNGTGVYQRDYNREEPVMNLTVTYNKDQKRFDGIGRALTDKDKTGYYLINITVEDTSHNKNGRYTNSFYFENGNKKYIFDSEGDFKENLNCEDYEILNEATQRDPNQHDIRFKLSSKEVKPSEEAVNKVKDNGESIIGAYELSLTSQTDSEPAYTINLLRNHVTGQGISISYVVPDSLKKKLEGKVGNIYLIKYLHNEYQTVNSGWFGQDKGVPKEITFRTNDFNPDSVYLVVSNITGEIITDDKKDDSHTTGPVIDTHVEDDDEKENGLIPVYRLYNPYSGEHLFTVKASEYKSLAGIGWKQEGTGWKSPVKGEKAVYRLYNPYSDEHLYTIKEDEYEQLGRIGWEKEGILFYSVGKDEEKKIPVFRLYNPYTGQHHYTTDFAVEYVTAAVNGWKPEGIAFYSYEA